MYYVHSQRSKKPRVSNAFNSFTQKLIESCSTERVTETKLSQIIDSINVKAKEKGARVPFTDLEMIKKIIEVESSYEEAYEILMSVYHRSLILPFPEEKTKSSPISKL